MAECPGLYRDRDLIQTGEVTGQAAADLAASTINKGVRLLQTLREWRQRWDDENPDAYFETMPSALEKHNLTSLWPTVYHFASLQIANSFALYNAVLVIILSLVHALGGTDSISTEMYPPNNPAGSNFTPSFIPNQSQVTAYSSLPVPTAQGPAQGSPEMAAAVEICRSVDYIIVRLEAGAVGFTALLMPMRVAWQVLGRNHSVEGQWLERAIEVIKGPNGWSLKGFQHLVHLIR